jgi:predicted phosphodiesterase
MYDSFIVIGDTHGKHREITRRVKSNDLNDMTLLHVGDFGMGFENIHTERAELGTVNKVLEKRNIHLYAIRGNHDDPAFFDGSWENEFSNIHLLPDYSIINVNGDDVLMVGGAISVDRKGRIRYIQDGAIKGEVRTGYWFDEAFVLDKEKLKNVKGARYVITHSCPKFVFPINKTHNKFESHGMFVEGFVLDGDITLKDDLNKEREDIAEMYNILKENNYIDKWLYGHFHKHNAQYFEDTDFVCVDINEFYEVRQ